MTEENYSNINMDPNEFMKRMKAIASDLWGGVPAEEEAAEPAPQPKPAAPEETAPARKAKTDIEGIWKTADETIDWTDALAHNTPTDGLTGPKMWAFFHKYAQKVLDGDLNAYTEVLQKANPLGELTEYAEGITMQAPSAEKLESTFICKKEQMEKNRKLYLAAMGLRIARDLLACLPVEEVTVTGEDEGKEVFRATYPRLQLLHRNFAFIDPVKLAEEVGGAFK